MSGVFTGPCEPTTLTERVIPSREFRLVECLKAPCQIWHGHPRRSAALRTTTAAAAKSGEVYGASMSVLSCTSPCRPLPPLLSYPPSPTSPPAVPWWHISGEFWIAQPIALKQMAVNKNVKYLCQNYWYQWAWLRLCCTTTIWFDKTATIYEASTINIWYQEIVNFSCLSMYCGYLKTQRSLQTESVSMVLKQPSVAK